MFLNYFGIVKWGLHSWNGNHIVSCSCAICRYQCSQNNVINLGEEILFFKGQSDYCCEMRCGNQRYPQNLVFKEREPCTPTQIPLAEDVSPVWNTLRHPPLMLLFQLFGALRSALMPSRAVCPCSAHRSYPVLSIKCRQGDHQLSSDLCCAWASVAVRL